MNNWNKDENIASQQTFPVVTWTSHQSQGQCCPLVTGVVAVEGCQFRAVLPENNNEIITHFAITPAHISQWLQHTFHNDSSTPFTITPAHLSQSLQHTFHNHSSTPFTITPAHISQLLQHSFHNHSSTHFTITPAHLSHKLHQIHLWGCYY